jgi:hypothetical protein
MNFRSPYVRWGIISLLLWLVCEVSAFYLGREVARVEYGQAMEQCALDLDEGCPQLFEYAGMLEDENARLNKRIRGLKEELDAK